MPQANQQIIATIIAVVVLLIAIGIIILLLAIYYTNTKKSLLKEKAQMQLAFEAEMAKTQLEVQEQTMQTIGADLHDNIGQLLSLTSLTLNSIELANLEKVQKKIDAAIDLTGRSIKEMRLLGKLLQGEQLISQGLPEAIRHEINWLEKSGKYEVTYTEHGEPACGTDKDKDLIIFRILQEILNNIIKHAYATRIDISLTCENQQMKLLVHDNGVGFNAERLSAKQQGMGLHNMHKRAGIIGGQVTIESTPESGTGITILIPYP